jgi:hypothetical protein
MTANCLSILRKTINLSDLSDLSAIPSLRCRGAPDRIRLGAAITAARYGQAGHPRICCADVE